MRTWLAITLLLALLTAPALATSLCRENIVNGDFSTETLAGWTGTGGAQIVEGRSSKDYAVNLLSDEGTASSSISQVINITGVDYITFYIYADDPWVGENIGNLTITANETVLYDKKNIILESFVPYTIDISGKNLNGYKTLKFSVGPKFVNIFIDDISAISCYIINPGDTQTAWASCDDAEAPLPEYLPLVGVGITAGAVIAIRRGRQE
jgi:hypothetical protein